MYGVGLQVVPVSRTDRMDRTLLVPLDLCRGLATTGSFLQEPSFVRYRGGLDGVPAVRLLALIWE